MRRKGGEIRQRKGDHCVHLCVSGLTSSKSGYQLLYLSYWGLVGLLGMRQSEESVGGMRFKCSYGCRDQG